MNNPTDREISLEILPPQSRATAVVVQTVPQERSDDFLAQGQALLGLINIVHQSGASLCGAGIVIEKVFKDGGRLVRDAEIEVYSLAQIASLKNGKILFR